MSTAPDLLRHLGGAPVGMEVLQPPDTHWVYSSATAAPYQAIQKHADRTHLHSSIATAHGLTTSARNDVVFLTPETHTVTAAITWSNSNTHLIGMHSPNRWANSCKVEQQSATTVTPLLTVSGSNNMFSNMHFTYGNGDNANNIIGLTVSGSNNYFENCWFEGPNHSSTADLAGFRLVRLQTGGGNTFKNCVFGTTSTTRGAANALVEYHSEMYRATFEDCIFYSWIDATTPTMFYVKSGAASGPMFYRNCQFVFYSTNAATTAAQLFGYAGNESGGFHIFDVNSQAYNVTDIGPGTSGPEKTIFWGTGVETDTAVGLAVTYNHTT